jgi:hypothetical protein
MLPEPEPTLPGVDIAAPPTQASRPRRRVAETAAIEELTNQDTAGSNHAIE